MKNNKHDCDLSSCFLCTLCLKEWLPAIAAHRKTMGVKKGTVIFEEGNLVTGIYFVNEGKVKVHKKWGADKELIVRIAGKGTILGHRGLGKSLYYPVSATALQNSAVCFIDMDFFQSTLKVNHDFTFRLMMFYAEELQESEKNMRNIAHMTVKGRVAQALLTLQENFGTNEDGFIDIELSRQDLASLVGATYETVFRTINELTEDKAIRIENKAICIVNAKQLSAQTNEVL